MKAMPPEDKRLIELGDKYAQWYIDGKFDWDVWLKLNSHKQVLHWIYQKVCQYKLITPLHEAGQEICSVVYDDCRIYFEKCADEGEIQALMECYWLLYCLIKNKTDVM